MTTREFLNIVVEANLSDEVTEKAQTLLVALDKRNENRSSKPSKRQLENQPIREMILGYLNGSEPKTAADIGEHCGITTQKASALCSQMQKEELLTAEEVKVPKKGKVKGYRIK